jgi:hypothetical protein
MKPLDRMTALVQKHFGDRLSPERCRKFARKVLLNGPPPSATDKEYHAFLVREAEKAIAEETH